MLGMEKSALFRNNLTWQTVETIIIARIFKSDLFYMCFMP